MTENTSKETNLKLKKVSWTNVILMISIAVLIFGLGYKFGQYRGGFITKPPLSIGASSNRTVSKDDVDFNLFWEVWNRVEEKFVDEKKLDAKKMYYGAIKGMVASLEDPYTFFLTPDENKKSKDDLGGRFEGIGAQLGMKENLIVVIAPLKNSPAQKEGILAGDIIIKVDGASTQGWTLNQAVGKIRGPGGTSVKLTINRGGKVLDFTIKRETIKVDSIELTYDNGNKPVAIIKLNQFGETTNSEWDKAAAEVTQKYRNGEIKGLVLDLRDNPGGYLESSVYIASEFLPEGKLVVKQDSTVEGERDYTVQRQGSLLDIPMVTMVNGGSASAAEILSGALRDHKRTKLVGEKSFGKGSVQEALDLSQGAGLHVTIAKWILPNGDWIHGKGITPEIQVKNEVKEGNTLTRDTDLQLNRAIDEVGK